MKISEHFTLEEFCFSEAGARLGLDNTPDDAVVANLRLVAATMMAAVVAPSHPLAQVSVAGPARHR